MTEIKVLEKEHLPFVARIEELCFSQPWSEQSLELLLRDGAVGFVALVDGTVAAYGGMMYVLDEGQITNIATHPSYRKRGLGRAVVNALSEYAQENGISNVYLEVRESNAAARRLYAVCGYTEIGQRRRFYRDPVEDAVLMKCKIDHKE
jgi:ribosomal-protein-alanine N-acetyltransferase